MDQNKHVRQPPLRQWLDAHRYKDVADHLLNTPGDTLSYQEALHLAEAYCGLGVLGDRNCGLPKPNREPLLFALNYLASCRDLAPLNTAGSYLQAYALFHLERYSEALPALSKAPRARGLGTSSRDMRRVCREQITLPSFQETFLQRSRTFWQDFSQQEEEFRRLLDKGSDAELEEKLFRLSATSLGLGYLRGYKRSRRYTLEMDPGMSRPMMFALHRLFLSMPASLHAKWNVIIGVPRSANGALISGDRVYRQEEILCSLSEGTVLPFRLFLHMPGPLPKDTDNTILLWDLVSQSIGGLTAATLLEEIGFSPYRPAPGSRTMPLSQLADTLAADGWSLSGDPETYYEEGMAGYNALEKQGSAPRQDILWGETMCLALPLSFADHSPEGWDILACAGAVPGFLYFPAGAFAGQQENRAFLQDFCLSLGDRLQAAAGEQNILILGYALGSQYNYLDFIAWDLPSCLEVVSHVFRETAVPWVRYHSYRYGAKPVLLLDRTGTQGPVLESLPAPSIPTNP